MMAKRDFPSGGFISEPPMSPTSSTGGGVMGGSPFSKVP